MVLSELLGASEPNLSEIIKRLEYAGGHPNIDVRLTAEIIGLAGMKTKELGLDSNDTSGRELYHSLQLLVSKHDKFLSKIMGSQEDESVKLEALVKTINKLDLPKGCWTLKNAAAKKLLKTTAPKQAMKILGYKSVDSMLKREQPSNIYLAIRLSEQPSWQEKFIKQYKDLRPSDFTKSDVAILTIDDKRLLPISKSFVKLKRHNILSLKEFGLITLLPLPDEATRGAHLTILTMLVNAVNEMRAHSTYLKLQQVKPNFGVLVSETLLGQIPGLTIAGQRLPWRIVHQYLSRIETIHHPDIFGPHVQPEDVAWHKPEDVLFRLEPALKFWENVDFVGALRDGQTVSFNLMDNSLNYCNNLPYRRQTSSYLQDSLLSELYLRYLLETPLGERMLNKLDDGLVGEHSSIFEEVGV